MKYIRTKDGKILSKDKIICSAFREEYCSPNWNEDIEKYLQTKIIAETDTIEELCDEFVLHYGDTMQTSVPIPWATYERRDEHWEENKQRLIAELNKPQRKAIVYGAIWTDKGLIYVAKMNDKGELELL